MKIMILFLFLILSSPIYAQNDSIQKERYEVINALYKDVDIEQYDQIEIDKNFFIFLGLSAIISAPEFIDNLYGHCADFENEKILSYSDIITKEDISEMHYQIGWLGNYKTVDSTLISDKIKLSDENNNSITATTLPLISNNKAIVYRTNRNNTETLFVLIKKDGEWIIRCRKNLYLRFDD
ncbi:hypothetical protein [Gillisia sp. CAL575]|uniref:hypothetical protein n=1 Tax=Gillisia sp. CAL575 TaxID=985255 RepID=UPI0003AAEC2F|nr:hypothetical protein [Gillisia sp. CAL575]